MADLMSPQQNVQRPAPPSGSGGLSGLRVSLMPSEGAPTPQQDLGRAIVILVIVLLVETLIIGGVYFYLAQTTVKRSDDQTALKTQITALDKDIKVKERTAKDVLTFAAQTTAVTEALDSHIYWSKFFTFIEANSTPTVRYANFSGDADTGQVILDAVAVSYRDMAEQIVLLRENPMIRTVRSTSASARVSATGEVTGVSFSMAVRFKPELMRGFPGVATAQPTIPAASSTTETAPVVPVNR